MGRLAEDGIDLPKRSTKIVVDPKTHRTVRYKRDMVGNDLTATLMWCNTHHQPVWVYDDGSYGCPHTHIVEWDTRDHTIETPPWESG